MSGSESDQNVAESLKSTASSDIRQPRQRMVQNCLLLWVDTSIDEANEDYENTLKQIRTITDDVNVFTQRDACIDYLTDAQEDIKSFLVVKDTMSQQIMPLINDIPQLDGVYILNDIETVHVEWTNKCKKIKSVHNIDDICHRLQLDIKRYHQDSIAMSFVTVNEMASTNNLNQLEPAFMYTQLFKEILLDIEHGEQAIKKFIIYCRYNDCVSSINIDRFEKEYDDQLAIWWYTFPSNIYSMLNQALRTMDADIIITMGFFLRDVHEQIQHLYEQQINGYGTKPFLVYRGQGLMKSDFKKLQKTIGGLMSFNNFLSTSTDKEVSLEFAECASTKPDTVGILFIMLTDPCLKPTPFACIKEISYFNREEEILFSMHTVFRVVAIKQTDNKNQFYQVELQLTSDDDQQLRVLTDRIRQEANGTGWQRLGSLLLKIGQLNKAEELYNVLLEQTSDESEKAIYYNQLGIVHSDQGDYEKAIWYGEQGLAIDQQTLPSNHPSLATPYNNISIAYAQLGEYSKALSFHEKALEIRQKTLPSNHHLLVTSYNNIGTVYDNMGEYSKALSFYEKALEIFQITLPSNHPYLATSNSNIGGVYERMGEYSKALSFYEKALEIEQKALPSNHPDLATLYNNIGSVYSSMGEYSKALSFYEKALEIQQKALPSNHPDLATLYNNIGSVYDGMREYSKALTYFEKALEIRQKTLPSDHPDLATSYSKIGSVYDYMREYSKALTYYEKALEIRQKTLPSNHPDLATSYNNIGLVYPRMGEYSKALSSHERALAILQKTLPSNHPDLANSYSNIGSVYYSMGEYSKALTYYEKAQEIQQKTLPSNHPSLATTYGHIGSVYDNMREHSKALSFSEKALEIRQNNLPSNHPSLATTYGKIGNVYDSMGEYSKALSYLRRALGIRQCALPPTHPDIKAVKENIEIVKEKMLKNS
ncbi:unnamed protein product [Adineta steineri]|uniref:NAD(P)(+)--arginine ADP-ribosyltransferase n=1 Tax=Adineta steineri TaxID=433720 RepID=A0A818HX72_9BILA|nr:unnamed protein product [Adineta steineri]CAF1322433.1 unnamed protein product [Adineta steineri]CAF3510991.1 unnamed protein product [Adineta steineri]CAF3708724.1 unnamed protein product [Adineta steineri]